ncbi:MAG: site-specific integrase [Hyphomonadaceae bacterium]|nr:site-specific integrase [Hyphomonadaceae bacterium]
MLGPELDVQQITPQHVLTFKSKMENLPKGTKAGTPFSELECAEIENRVSPVTAKKKFDTIKSFLLWMGKSGVIDKVPGQGLSIKKQKKAKSEERRGFEPHELDTLLSSPLFTGALSKHRRTVKGEILITDDIYWMPLVLLYSGMRMAEPVQLAAEDVVLDGPVPYFQLLHKKIKLKTAQSERKVPIHPDLVAFGFLDFVHARQKSDPAARLFREITQSKDISGAYSKRFGRYRRAIGLNDPLLVAHSFRHGFKTALRNAMVPEGVEYFLTGHTISSASHKYGKAPKVEVLAEHLGKIDFGISPSVKAQLISNAGA